MAKNGGAALRESALREGLALRGWSAEDFNYQLLGNPKIHSRLEKVKIDNPVFQICNGFFSLVKICVGPHGHGQTHVPPYPEGHPAPVPTQKTSRYGSGHGSSKIIVEKYYD